MYGDAIKSFSSLMGNDQDHNYFQQPTPMQYSQGLGQMNMNGNLPNNLGLGSLGNIPQLNNVDAIRNNGLVLAGNGNKPLGTGLNTGGSAWDNILGGLKDKDGNYNWLGKGGIMDYGLQGLQTITGIWNAHKANKLARDQFNFQKDIANANLNNTISSYNTRLSDRARSRGFVEGQSQEQIDKYVNDNKLRR